MSFLSRSLLINSRYFGRIAFLRNGIHEKSLVSTSSRIPIQSIQARPSSSDMPPKPPKDDKDANQYVIKFKETNVKEVFKKFYSLYGPLFIVCHIGISLTSVGFFYSLVYLSIDPAYFLPDALINLLGETMANMTGSGGKFMIAYAIHKLLLPFRLGFAIWLTKYLAPKLGKLKKIIGSK